MGGGTGLSLSGEAGQVKPRFKQWMLCACHSFSCLLMHIMRPASAAAWKLASLQGLLLGAWLQNGMCLAGYAAENWQLCASGCGKSTGHAM